MSQQPLEKGLSIAQYGTTKDMDKNKMIHWNVKEIELGNIKKYIEMTGEDKYTK